jgi:hypothetical protein
MMATNVNNEASGVSARHFYIALHDGDNDSNYGNDDDECRQRGLGREHPAFLHCVVRWR